MPQVQATLGENNGILAPAFLFRLLVTGRAVIELGVEINEMKTFDALIGEKDVREYKRYWKINHKPNNRRLTSTFNFTGTVFYLSIAAVKIVCRISGSFLVSRQTNDFPAGSRLDK